jgi:SAM-dependent methyltransferase
MVGDYKDYRELIETRVLDEEQFRRATFSGNLPGQIVPWIKVVIRPVLVKAKRALQFSYFDSRKDITKNYIGNEVNEKLRELLTLPFRNFHLETTTHVVQINLSKKGKPLIRETKVKEPDRKEVNLSHNREKDLILPANKPEPFLQAVGIMTQEGKIKSDMQSKFRQINEYLKLVEQTDVLHEFRPNPVHVVDCGCGNAYLTFATYHYFTNVLGLDTKMVGIDVQDNLLQRHIANAQSLGWDNLRFEATQIIDYKPDFSPDVVLALHACDTATDEAIAQGIKWRSKLIVTAPCCHHELQVQLHNQSCPVPFRSVARYGILSERLGDILTDTFRALILRIMGYRTDVVQFVASEHTAKNLMIRSVGGLRVGDRRFIREYNELKEYWQVTPYLERLLAEEFTKLLAERVEVESDADRTMVTSL